MNDLLPDFQQLFGNTGWEDYPLGYDEFRQFQQFAKSFEDLILDPATTAPTALHAWGNQTKSCACGCRPPFSNRRLTERGLFGALVKEQTPDGPKFRHASAIEVTLLNGYPMSHANHPGRLLLAGVGQLASPIHSALIFACLHRQLRAGNFDVVNPIEARESIAAVCNALFAMRDRVFNMTKTVPMVMFEESLTDLLGYPVGSRSHEFKVTAHASHRPAETWECPFQDCPLKQVQPEVTDLPRDDRSMFAEVISPTVNFSVLPLPGCQTVNSTLPEPFPDFELTSVSPMHLNRPQCQVRSAIHWRPSSLP